MSPMMQKVYGPLPSNAVRPEGDWCSFGDAFATARREGWPQFRWRGAPYHTRQGDDPGMVPEGRRRHPQDRRWGTPAPTATGTGPR